MWLRLSVPNVQVSRCLYSFTIALVSNICKRSSYPRQILMGWSRRCCNSPCVFLKSSIGIHQFDLPKFTNIYHNRCIFPLQWWSMFRIFPNGNHVRHLFISNEIVHLVFPSPAKSNLFSSAVDKRRGSQYGIQTWLKERKWLRKAPELNATLVGQLFYANLCVCSLVLVWFKICVNAIAYKLCYRDGRQEECPELVHR